MLIEVSQYGEYFKQYEKLIHKIAHQYEGVSNESYDDLYSAACEGFVNALKTFDGVGNFNQWLAFGCRNSVLTSINQNSRIIKVPAYGQKQIEAGKAEAISTSSLDINFDGSDVYTDHIIAIGVEDSKVEEEKTLQHLYKMIESKFSKMECEILYKKFGINGFKVVPCGEMAKEYSISAPKISSILKKIYTYLSKNESLRDDCMELLNRM